MAETTTLIVTGTTFEPLNMEQVFYTAEEVDTCRSVIDVAKMAVGLCSNEAVASGHPPAVVQGLLPHLRRRQRNPPRRLQVRRIRGRRRVPEWDGPTVLERGGPRKQRENYRERERERAQERERESPRERAQEREPKRAQELNSSREREMERDL